MSVNNGTRHRAAEARTGNPRPAAENENKIIAEDRNQMENKFDEENGSLVGIT